MNSIQTNPGEIFTN